MKHHKQNTSRQQRWLRVITATPTRLVEKTSQLVLHVSLPLLQILLLCSAQLEQKSQLVSIKKKKSKVIILHSRVDELRFSPHQQVLLVDESEPVHQQVLLILIWKSSSDLFFLFKRTIVVHFDRASSCSPVLPLGLSLSFFSSSTPLCSSSSSCFSSPLISPWMSSTGMN